jgi:exodeoxyribonuclease VII large subunit
MEGMRLRVKGFTDYRRLGLAQVMSRSKTSIEQYFRIRKDALARYEQVAVLKDPVNILKMGYSITLKDGKPVKSVFQIEEGNQLTTQLTDGVVVSMVNSKQQNPKNK